MADVLFYLKKLLTALVLPPLAPLCLLVLGLLLLRRRPRAGQALAWAGVAMLTLCALPLTSQVLARIVQIPSGLAGASAQRAQAVVILGGGRKRAPEYGGETVSAVTLERVRYGAKLARERQLPVLLSGGTVFQGKPESELMDQALYESFGIRARWVERAARDTHQNALYSAAILEKAGIHTVLLVTHDYHQRRSLAEFTAADIEAVSAPVSTVVLPASNQVAIEQLPNARVFASNVTMLHEILGNLVISLSQALGR